MARIRCPHCQRTFAAPTTQQAKGGRARAAKLDPEARREIAQKAARARWARRVAPLVLAMVTLYGCGGSSPTGPTPAPVPAPAPTPPPAPPPVASIIEVQACPPQILGFAVDLTFYQQIGCNSFDGPSQPVRRWTRAPSLYLRTVDEAGAPIDAVTLNTVQAAMEQAAPLLSAGKIALTVERGSDSRVGVSGWITVRWPATIGIADPATACGRSQVATDGGWIELSHKIANCGCNGSEISPGLARHELGHALGYWHTDNPSDVMSNLGATKPCDRSLSAREQQAVLYHYR